jgi:hypothetical protein
MRYAREARAARVGVLRPLAMALMIISCADAPTKPVQVDDAAMRSIYTEHYFETAAVTDVVGDPQAYDLCWTLEGPSGWSGTDCGSAHYSPPFIANVIYVQPYGDPWDEANVTVYVVDLHDVAQSYCSPATIESGGSVSCELGTMEELGYPELLQDIQWDFAVGGGNQLTDIQQEGGPVSSSTYSIYPSASGYIGLTYSIAGASPMFASWEITVSTAPTAIDAISLEFVPYDEVYLGGSRDVEVTVTPATAGVLINLEYVGVGVNAGGHTAGGRGVHPARPGGTFSPASGYTDASGKFRSTYTAREHGGHDRLRARAGTLTDTKDLLIQNLIPLDHIGSNPNFTLVGVDDYHPRALGYYVAFNAHYGLHGIADEYGSVYFPSKMEYNDMSLPLGGRYDLSGNFASPHAEHRYGINCDVRLSAIPHARRAFVEQLFVDYGSPNFLPEFSRNHWHLRFD